MNTTNLMEMNQVQAIEAEQETLRELTPVELALVGGGFDLNADF